MNAGASYFMLKPFDIKILGERIKSMLDIDTDISSDSSYTKNKQSMKYDAPAFMTCVSINEFS